MPTTETKIDLAKVLLANIGGIGLTFTNLENGLKVLALIITISYTSWKWYKDYKSSNE
jgi:hypothetical protein